LNKPPEASILEKKCPRSLDDREIIVEVGVWFGRSAIAMADACRGTNKKVFAIDP